MNRITITLIASFGLFPVVAIALASEAHAQVYENPYEQSGRNLEQRQQVERDRSEDFQRAYNTPPSGFATDATRQQATEQNYYRQQREEAQQWRRESPQFDPQQHNRQTRPY